MDDIRNKLARALMADYDSNPATSSTSMPGSLAGPSVADRAVDFANRGMTLGHLASLYTDDNPFPRIPDMAPAPEGAQSALSLFNPVRLATGLLNTPHDAYETVRNLNKPPQNGLAYSNEELRDMAPDAFNLAPTLVGAKVLAEGASGLAKGTRGEASPTGIGLPDMERPRPTEVRTIPINHGDWPSTNSEWNYYDLNATHTKPDLYVKPEVCRCLATRIL